MTTRILCYLAVLMLLFSACSEKKFIIEGKLSHDGFDGRRVYLSMMNDDLTEYIEVDSTFIVGDAFQFTGNVPDSIIGLHLFFGKVGDDRFITSPVIIIPEEGTIRVSFDDEYTATQTGPYQNERIGEFLRFSYDAEIEKSKILSEIMKNRNPEEPLIYTERYLELGRIIGDSTYSYLQSMKNTPLFDELLIKYGSRVRSIKQFDELAANYSARLVRSAKANTQKKREEGHSQPGEMFLELKCLDMNNNEVLLSQYLGKGYPVLLEFWSSGCGPCIAHIPELKEIYAELNRKGFEIISISMDSHTTRWTKALEKHDMPWLQLLNMKGRGSAGLVYGFRGIPYSVLIDKNGKVVSKGRIYKEEMAELVE
ncbi:AhpC/TSA family protein [Bacteroides sp. 214]|uniref:TlpA disulfide reductase family protein n=1 Tax=Bacteroides sp. 214 TaxID=2302935 RepID=UPI0013D53B75|nr:TlpA disulfide reductase family protein [Bacteroides sp. 214]NDW13350.1 AhpC/TSA family protein [Bacteroides sp. 214]